MNFVVEKITPNIFHLIFPSAHLTCRTMVRFAEHFEGVKFRKKIFSLRQFKRWYTHHKGIFSYYDDWGGFNIPSYVFDSFKTGSFDPLSYGEKDVLSQLPPDGTYYVIASGQEDSTVIRHEMAHACYYLNEKYRQEANRITQNLPGIDKVKRQLLFMGYHPEVIDDELHAYAGDGLFSQIEILRVKENASVVALFQWALAGYKLNRLLNRTLQEMNKHNC